MIHNANILAIFRHNVQRIRVVIVMPCNLHWIHPARLGTHLGCQFLNIAISFVCPSNAFPMKNTLDQQSQWHFGFLHALSNKNTSNHLLALEEMFDRKWECNTVCRHHLTPEQHHYTDRASPKKIRHHQYLHKQCGFTGDTFRPSDNTKRKTGIICHI